MLPRRNPSRVEEQRLVGWYSAASAALVSQRYRRHACDGTSARLDVTLRCFFLVPVWQVGVIATADYAGLNHLVLRSQSFCWLVRFCDVLSQYTGGTVRTNLPRFWNCV
jgi:hypothetical protein